jgi:hypothetical protein
VADVAVVAFPDKLPEKLDAVIVFVTFRLPSIIVFFKLATFLPPYLEL